MARGLRKKIKGQAAGNNSGPYRMPGVKLMVQQPGTSHRGFIELLPVRVLIVRFVIGKPIHRFGIRNNRLGVGIVTEEIGM